MLRNITQGLGLETRSIMVCTSHSTFFGLSYQEHWHAWERGKVHAEFWWRDLKGKRKVGRPRRRSGVILKIDI
jgi:hypothetical protein